MTKKIVVLWDWDGSQVDTMPIHADLAADCIVKHFGISREAAREKYLETTGVPFGKQLVMIFPRGELSARSDCAHEYSQRKSTEVYGNPINFPETVKTIRSIAENFTDVIQIISSSTEESLIEKWALRDNLAQYFFRIYGYEHGSKNAHIAIVRRMFPEAEIVFIGDSVGDMKVESDYHIGVQVGDNREEFFSQGADVVIDGPITAQGIIWALCEIL
jgi:phosphoglycolate phosphatase-like HAD superfamily hydrolase